MGNDNTVKWERRSLQLPPSRLRPHFVKTTVRVHEYPDGRLAVFWGPHRLADYAADGSIIQPEVCAIPRIASGRKSGSAMPRPLGIIYPKCPGMASITIAGSVVRVPGALPRGQRVTGSRPDPLELPHSETKIAAHQRP